MKGGPDNRPTRHDPTHREHKRNYQMERRVNIMLSLVQQVATRSAWQGRPAYRRPKGRKGPQHAGPSEKRWEAGANQAAASRDPPGMVKAGLLQAQSSAADKSARRYVG